MQSNETMEAEVSESFQSMPYRIQKSVHCAAMFCLHAMHGVEHHRRALLVQTPLARPKGHADRRLKGFHNSLTQSIAMKHFDVWQCVPPRRESRCVPQCP